MSKKLAAIISSQIELWEQVQDILKEHGDLKSLREATVDLERRLVLAQEELDRCNVAAARATEDAVNSTANAKTRGAADAAEILSKARAEAAALVADAKAELAVIKKDAAQTKELAEEYAKVAKDGHAEIHMLSESLAAAKATIAKAEAIKAAMG
jgi:hypothetical protein